MKRAGLTSLLVLALLLVLAVPAWAETPGYTTDDQGVVTYDAASGKYSATYAGAAANGMYVLLVVAGDGSTITVDNITYIDQANVASNASGVSFTGFIPKTITNSTVLLGDTTLEAPVKLGTLIAQGGTVSGTITNGAGAEVTLGSGGINNFTADETMTTTADSNGAYSLDNVAQGSYTMRITRQSCLPLYISIEVDGDLELNPVFTPCRGDIDANGTIHANDVGLLTRAFGTSAAGHECDLDMNGDVHANDLSILLSNFSNTTAGVAQLKL